MENKVTYTIRCQDGEFTVRFRLDGVRKPDWDYFTDSREDAEATAKATIQHHEEYVQATGLVK